MGQTLLASELTALSYWLVMDEERKGQLEQDKFFDLLHGWRFDTRDWKQEDFEKEFAFTMAGTTGEIKKGLYRWDLGRRIFLERGL